MDSNRFVSYDIARYLHNIGFYSDECIALYYTGYHTTERELDINTAIYEYGAEDYLESQYGIEWQRFPYYLAPTPSEALRWLREKGIYVFVRLDNKSEIDRRVVAEVCVKVRSFITVTVLYDNDSFEAAELAGLKYALVNFDELDKMINGYD